MTEDDASTASGIERIAPPASESRDSAIQYVSIDLLENGFDADEQREYLEPVEEEIREHMDAVLRDGMRRTFHQGHAEGARYAISELIAHLSFEDVPEDHREEIAAHVKDRLWEKRDQLEEVYHDLMEDALHKAGVIPEDEIVNWGPVV